MMGKQKNYLFEYIYAIEQNYPPEHNPMLREALDYCLNMLKQQVRDEIASLRAVAKEKCNDR